MNFQQQQQQQQKRNPFFIKSLQEANYLFYSTSFFPCCKQLEKYSFNVVADDDNEGEAQAEEVLTCLFDRAVTGKRNN